MGWYANGWGRGSGSGLIKVGGQMACTDKRCVCRWRALIKVSGQMSFIEKEMGGQMACKDKEVDEWMVCMDIKVGSTD